MIDAKDHHFIVSCVEVDIGIAVSAAKSAAERSRAVAEGVRDATIAALQGAEQQMHANLNGKLFEPKETNISTLRQDNAVIVTVVLSYIQSNILAGSRT